MNRTELESEYEKVLLNQLKADSGNTTRIGNPKKDEVFIPKIDQGLLYKSVQDFLYYLAQQESITAAEWRHNTPKVICPEKTE